MSDPEDDREFLEEIKALEDVLANEETSSLEKIDNNKPIITSDTKKVIARRANNPSSSRGFGEVEEKPESDSLENLAKRHSAYETNKKLIELLIETRQELLTILERCVENKTIVNAKIRTRAKIAKSTRVLICTAGMPYFKDAKHYPAPWNADVRRKMRNAELQVVQLRHACPWTAKDRNILWRAIRQEAAEDVLERERSRENSAPGGESSIEGNEPGQSIRVVYFGERSRESIAESLNLPKNFRSMIGPLGSKEFDWLKIAAMDFEERHTADECRVMWRVFLHPDVNRYRWSKEEDVLIKRLAVTYKSQNWDLIAEKLNTRRSGYQCFIRYNSINGTGCNEDKQWSSREDDRLSVCVKKFQIGGYIPWGTVARYMGGRTKSQVYYRWMYNISPRLKKGRFTDEEDERLLEAVRRYGKNFCKISKSVITDRSSAQLSDHYATLIVRKRGIQNTWSINDDARLLILYNNYGPDWSSIAGKLTGKTRTQVRHRHNAIIRYWDKGVSLYEIPRDYNYRRTDERDANDEMQDDEAIQMENNELIQRLERDRISKINVEQILPEMEPIDAELTKYFQLIPGASKPGRKRKYYSDEELEDMTRKLCVILKALNTSLVINDEEEDRAITEKDKQLLISLMEHQRLQTINSKFPKTNGQEQVVTYYNENSAINGERHFAPLCTGNCNLREKIRCYENIDYAAPSSPEHCQITLCMKFCTPEMVVELVGDEKNLEFEKIMKMFVTQRIRPEKTNVFEEIYVTEPGHRPKMFLNAATKRTREEASSANRETLERNSAADGGKKKRATKREKQWNSSTRDGIIQRLDQPMSFIEPNYYTLLGLQHIISKPKTSCEEDFTEYTYEMSEEGKKSMAILKRRLVQLFKYPIGLSHIIRPDVYIGRNTEGIAMNNEETSIVKGIVVDRAKISSPPAKKARH